MACASYWPSGFFYYPTVDRVHLYSQPEQIGRNTFALGKQYEWDWNATAHTLTNQLSAFWLVCSRPAKSVNILTSNDPTHQQEKRHYLHLGCPPAACKLGRRNQIRLFPGTGILTPTVHYQLIFSIINHTNDLDYISDCAKSYWLLRWIGSYWNPSIQLELNDHRYLLFSLLSYET